MYLTLTLLILCTAIIVFFVDDFVSLYKKIIKIPGVVLLVPLLAASWLVIEYEYYITIVLLHLYRWLGLLACRQAEILPLSSFSQPVARVFLLSAISILPGLALAWYFERKYKPIKPAQLLTAILFTFFSIMLTGVNLKFC